MAEKLNAQEKAELDAFIVKCVMNNASFPSEKIGVNKITIQQLLNEFSVDSLVNFGDFIEKKLNANGSSFKSRKGVLRFSNIPATELVTALHLIIKHKEYEEEEGKRKERVAFLKIALDDLKTPEERKKELEAELKALEA